MHPEYDAMPATLQLCSGGQLYYKKWSMEDRKGNVFDVSDKPLRFLMYDCSLQPGLKLRDVFDFIEANIQSLEPILGNWVCEFIEEAKRPFDPKDDAEIEKLELYWHIESDEDFGTDGMLWPSFHGLGKDGTPYGVDFSAANRLADLPVVLRKDAEVFVCPKDRTRHSMVQLQDVSYSLLGILYAIIWELSFFGPPKKRDGEVEKLMDAVKEAKEHPERLIPLDEVLDRIEQKSQKSPPRP